MIYMHVGAIIPIIELLELMNFCNLSKKNTGRAAKKCKSRLPLTISADETGDPFQCCFDIFI